MKIRITDIKRIGVYLLPLITIMAQWISVAGIRASWILSVILLVCVGIKYKKLQKCKDIIILGFIIVVVPFITFCYSESSVFNLSLYISLITGLTNLLYIFILEEREYNTYINGCLFACIVFAFLGVFEIFTGKYTLSTNTFFTARINSRGRFYPITAFANVNDLTQYLVMLFPIAAARNWKKQKILIGCSLVAILFVIYHAEAKLAFITILMAFPIAYFLEAFTTKKAKMWQIIVGGLFFLLLIFLTLGLYLGIPQKIINYLRNFSFEIDFIKARMEIYVPLLERSLRMPIGGFGTSYVLGKLPPHNLLLFILCDYGWVVFICFITFLIKMFLELVKKAKVQEKDKMEYYMLAMLCLFPITSMISSCNEQRKVIWIYLGVCIYRAWVSNKKEKNI